MYLIEESCLLGTSYKNECVENGFRVSGWKIEKKIAHIYVLSWFIVKSCTYQSSLVGTFEKIPMINTTEIELNEKSK